MTFLTILVILGFVIWIISLVAKENLKNNPPVPCAGCGGQYLRRKITDQPLCEKCAGPVLGEIQQILRQISESQDLINNGKTVATRMGRIDFIIDICDQIAPYFDAGVKLDGFDPHEVIRTAEYARPTILREEAEKIASEAVDKSALATTSRTSANALARGREKLRQLSREYDCEGIIKDLDAQMARASASVEAKGHVESAEKAEMKGNKKKALDCYIDALYHLQNDDVPDEEQTDMISELENRIQRLRSEL